MAQLMIYLSLLVVATVAFGEQQDEKLLRVALGKKTSAQAGELGQPITSYYAHVDVGTPPRPFKLLIDINARELWLPYLVKPGLFQASRLNHKSGYAKELSTTSIEDVRKMDKISYKGTVLSCSAYDDVFEFKNVTGQETNSQPVVKYRQRFLSVTSASDDKFIHRFGGADGVLALAPWLVSGIGSDMTTTSLTRASLTSERKFGLWLNPNSTSEEDGGELTFGGANPARFESRKLKIHKTVTPHSWELNLNRVMLKSYYIGDCKETSCTVLLSTTSNDIRGPAESIRKIYSLLDLDVGTENGGADLKLNSLQEIDCSLAATGPVLAFIIDNVYYVLDATSYIRKKVKSQGWSSKSVETCYVALLPNGSSNKWELGTSFLENYYTVFDQDSQQVGLADLK